MTMRFDHPVILSSTAEHANFLSFLCIILMGKPSIQTIAGLESGAHVDAVEEVDAPGGETLRLVSGFFRGWGAASEMALNCVISCL
eukprot:14429022-Heterocapsa_arctica.AAC.1